MASPSGKMPFPDFCAFLTKLRGKGYEAVSLKRHQLSNFFYKLKEGCDGDDDYQARSKDIISILLSDSNKMRKLDLGEKKLTDLVCKVVGIQGLSSKKIQGEGTVAMRLGEEVCNRMDGNPSNMTVSDVCQRLDLMSSGNVLKKQKEVEYFTQNCSKEELIWIFNTMMRNTASFLGLTRTIITDCISPEASEVWKNTRDLDRLTNRPAEITDPDYFLGVNFCPQLLARLSLETIDEQVNQNLKDGFYMEIKFDGEHVLVHKKGTSYRWFTRNGKDYTEHYGAHHEEKLAAQIHPVFKSSVEDCIIDCELMHYHEKAGRMIRHLDKAGDGVTLSYKNPQPGHRIVVVVFDLLYFGGKVRGKKFKEDLMQVPLSDRVEIMTDRLLKRNEHHNIFIPDRSEGTTGDDIRLFYKAAATAGEEGIAVKRKDSLYHIGARGKKNGWFKLKEMFDMDLVIVGYVPRTSSKEAAFLLAAWDETSHEGRELAVICKSHAGLKDFERDKIMDDARMDGRLLKAAPDCLKGWTAKEDYLYFHPGNYVVVEANAYGIRNGSLIDVVMRRLREDKCICREDIDDYKAIKKHQPGQNDIRLEYGANAASSSSANLFKSKQITKRGLLETSAVPATKQAKIDTGSPLQNKTVCVLPGFDEKHRKRCWSILERFGAKVIANPTPSTDFIVAPSENHLRVKTEIKKNNYSIVNGTWLLRCEEKGKIQSWRPSEMILEVPGSFSIE